MLFHIKRRSLRSRFSAVQGGVSKLSSCILAVVEEKGKVKASRDSGRWTRHNPQNRLQAYVGSTELGDILRASRLTRDDLLASFLPGAVHPKLNTSGTKICCFDGRHRLKAAQQFHADC
jgi:hypothetical protein